MYPRIRHMDSLLVGIPHSIDCDAALDASSMLTCETPPPPGHPIHSSGRLSQNRGRHQIRTLDAISSEFLDGLCQNPALSRSQATFWTCSDSMQIIPNVHAAVVSSSCRKRKSA